VNSRFAVSVHILTVLAARTNLLTSEAIAQHVGTNPAVVRRLVGALQKAGFVNSKLGPGGGLSLARAADTISLACVYRAVREEGEQLLLPEAARSGSDCDFARKVMGSLEGKCAEAEAALRLELERTTIAEVLLQAQSEPTKPGFELQSASLP
jgi:Rrf2 family protein